MSTGFSYNEGGSAARGNLTQDGSGATYTYDAESRLRTVNGTGANPRFGAKAHNEHAEYLWCGDQSRWAFPI